MKIPKKINRYCKYCRHHTEHTVSQAKKKERGSLKRGSLERAKKRGLGRGYGNLGKYGSKPAISKWKRAGAKTSKKVDLRYKCKNCGKSSVQRKGFRTKKPEIK
ncbi:50S ribosomal protein L44e [Candidatus Woesearchaeota archaeon]|nr:50S ribosomal protein L44e [Candidatus Woesearchaeota archaeon]